MNDRTHFVIVTYAGDISSKLPKGPLSNPIRLNAEGNTEQSIEVFGTCDKLMPMAEQMILQECLTLGTVLNIRRITREIAK